MSERITDSYIEKIIVATSEAEEHNENTFIIKTKHCKNAFLELQSLRKNREKKSAPNSQSPMFINIMFLGLFIVMPICFALMCIFGKFGGD